jgi:hypothetical protein
LEAIARGEAVNTAVRVIVGIFMTVVAFVALATVGFIALRIAWPQYAIVEQAVNAYYAGGPAAQFDEMMMIARLVVAAVSSTFAAWVTALTLRDGRVAPLAGGLALLAVFIPIHYGLWDKFPIWYHATFLTSLLVLAFVGGRLAPNSN